MGFSVINEHATIVINGTSRFINQTYHITVIHKSIVIILTSAKSFLNCFVEIFATKL